MTPPSGSLRDSQSSAGDQAIAVRDEFHLFLDSYEEETLMRGSLLSPADWLLSPLALPCQFRAALEDRYWLYRNYAKASPSAEGPPPKPAVPGYEILSRLEGGNMGIVYKARHLALNRVVALKTLPGGVLAQPDKRKRFHQETKTLARIQHPNVVQIYDVGECGGQPYFAMEFVAGGSLDRKLDGTPWLARPAAELVETLARAVHVVHQLGIIHRDLKPSNVLLQAPSADSRDTVDCTSPKIADFGLVKLSDSDPGQTPPDVAVGTPSYMSPEQAAGASKEVTAAADVYALGAILYELLTGRPPFRGVTAVDTILQVIQDEPVPPLRLNPKADRDLETVCLKCLQKAPKRRYASAAALADDLRRFLDGRPIVARRVGAVERGWRWCRQNPPLAAAISVGAALLIALVGGAFAWAYSEKLRNAELKQLNTDLEEQRGTAERNGVLADRAAQRLVRVTSGYVASRLSDEDVRKLSGSISALKRFRDEDSTLAALREALDYLDQLSADSPGKTDHRRTLANLSLVAGVMFATSGQPSKAEPLLKKAIDTWQGLTDQDDQDAEALSELATSYYFLGATHRDVGHLEQAESMWLKSIELQEKLTLHFGDNAQYVSNLGRTYYNMGVYAHKSKKFADALPWQGKAIATLQPLSGKPEEDWFLAAAYYGRGLAHTELHQDEPARADFEKSVPLTKDHNEKRERQLALAFADAYCGYFRKAVAEAEKAVGADPTNGDERYKLACVLALAAGGARKDAQMPPVKAAELVEQYAGRSIRLLRKAHEANYFKTAEARKDLRDDPDLDPLRQRPDFRKLLADLDGPREPLPPPKEQ